MAFPLVHFPARVAGPRGAVSAAPPTAPAGPVDGSTPPADPTTVAPPDDTRAADAPPPGKAKVTPDEERIIAQLQDIDRNVRTHESAHQAAGAGLAGGASFSYRVGPDGKQYAVGGEVSIDMSPESDAAATITKMRRVRAAALAPMDPSAQDLMVATEASQLEAQAQEQVRAQQQQDAHEVESHKAGAGERPASAAALRAARAYGAVSANLQTEGFSQTA